MAAIIQTNNNLENSTKKTRDTSQLVNTQQTTYIARMQPEEMERAWAYWHSLPFKSQTCKNKQ